MPLNGCHLGLTLWDRNNSRLKYVGTIVFGKQDKARKQNFI